MSGKGGILIFGCLLVTLAKAQTECVIKDTCTHPKVAENVDLVWFRDTAPPDGWHMEIGNSVARLHIAELIQGKLLSYNDDYSKMCGRAKLVHAVEATEGVDGNYFGFDDNKVDFQCHHNENEKGVLDCDYSSTGLSKYAEKKIHNYVTYADNKNVMIVVKCFPNGESGWYTLSKTTSLADDERKMILNHVKAIGYDTKDVVEMYNENCKFAGGRRRRKISRRLRKQHH